MSEVPVNRSRWLVVCLSLIPLWLALSAGVAVWWSFQSDDKEEEERNQRFAMEMSVERIADDMRKLDEVIGPRDHSNTEALIRTAALIDGTLGPSNTGYRTKRTPGPDEAPVIHATLSSSKGEAEHYWVIASYDSAPKSATTYEGASTAVAAAIAAAQSMARDKLEAHIHFLFIPCGNDPSSDCAGLIQTLLSTMDRPRAVFYLGPMGFGPELMVSGTLDEASTEIQALGQVGNYFKSSDMTKAANEIHSTGLPTLNLMTPLGAKLHAPAPTTAITAGKLVEWLRRAARLAAQD